MKEDEVFNGEFENAERIGYLIAQFIKGELTPLERKELDQWILQSEKNEILFDELTDEENVQKTMEWYAGINQEKALQRIKKRISFTDQKRRMISFPFVAIAASVLVIAGIAGFLVWQNVQRGKDIQPVAVSQEILPAANKAVLTIAGGKQIVLDSAASKTLAAENISMDEGLIAYNNGGNATPTENVLTVPRGTQFTIVLPDGTKVWLNAESSLKYATSFVGNERRVVLTGEAYFEVTKNKEKPFIVASSGNEIKVLGTKFNVNSYGDENVFTTTLVEGSVQITGKRSSKILKPGEQARVGSNAIDVIPVDTQEAIAWKDGEFVFRNAPVHAIAMQLARWYNLDVEFRDPVDKHLNATIPRNVPLSKVLHYLEETGDVHFKLEERKLVVMN